MIKIHVTEEQRDMLQFLVERRIRDIYFALQKKSNFTIAQATAEASPELITLRELKKELEHAGT